MKTPTMTRAPQALRPPFPAIRWIVAAAFVTLASVACDVHSPSGPGDVETLTVSPTQTTLEINGTQQLVALALDADGREISVTGSGATSSLQWEVVNGGGTVDASGLFRAGTEIGTFTNTVRVSLGDREAFASFTVTAGPAASITVTPDPDTLGVGETGQFSATAMDAGGNSVPVTPIWTVVNGGGTIDSATGMFTAGSAPGTFENTVQATSGGLSGSATVTVTGSLPSVITISPNPAMLGVGDSVTFTATAVDSNGDSVDFAPVWSVENGGGTIDDSTGVFTADSTAGTFESTVRATSGSVSATATVIVTDPNTPDTITISPNPATLAVGDTVTFTASALNADGDSVDFAPVWSVENGGGTIDDSTGVFTADSTAGTFESTVRATSGSVFATATVIVTDPNTPDIITISPNPATLGVGDTVTFTATALNADGDSVDFTPVWSVENGGGMIDDSTGLFTADTTAGTFASTVRATSGSVSATATVIVTDPMAPAVITVSPNPATLGVGDTVTFTASALNADGDSVDFAPVWSVENGGGMIDDSTGLFTADTTAGTFASTVRATSGSAFGSATVIVTDSSGVVITVSPNPRTLVVNDTATFTATAVDANGDTLAVTPIWSVENGGGTINDSTGVFTAGPTAGVFENTVRATSGGVFGSATVNITTAPAPNADVLGAAAPNGIMAGTEVTCVAEGLISADVSIHPGSTITGYPPCTITGTQNLGNALAEQMQIDLATAYNTLAGLPCDPSNAIVADLGGTTLTPGVYCTASGIGVTGTLTLDGNGDPNAEFIFQAGTSLTTAGSIVLINGAQAENVYWQVGSSATLGTASQWQGNIVALTSITLVDTATLIGRALARNGAVTLGTGNTITLP